MKKFHFTLQPVLEQREKQEEAAQTALAERMRELEELQARAVELECERGRCQEMLMAPVGASVDSSERKLTHMYLTELSASLELCVHGIAGAEQAVTAARNELLEATRQRQVVAKLRQKQADEHRKALQSEEQKTLDEISVTKHGRKEGHA